jgi:hypothetical protein
LVHHWGKDVKDVKFEPDPPRKKQEKRTPPRQNQQLQQQYYQFQPPQTAAPLMQRSIELQREGTISSIISEQYFTGGNQARVLLALDSRLENEVAWALSKLIKYSFHCPPNFSLSLIPGLLDSLVGIIEPFFSSLQLNKSPNNFETTISKNISETARALLPSLDTSVLFHLTKDQEEMFNRIFTVLHIIRNFSFIQPNSVVFL